MAFSTLFVSHNQKSTGTFIMLRIVWRKTIMFITKTEWIIRTVLLSFLGFLGLFLGFLGGVCLVVVCLVGCFDTLLRIMFQVQFARGKQRSGFLFLALPLLLLKLGLEK